VDDTFDEALVDDDQGGDFLFFHLDKGGGGEGAGGDGLGGAVHDVAGSAVEGVGADALEQAAEIAVGDDAGEGEAGGLSRFLRGLGGGLEDGGHAEFFAGHLVDDFGHGGGGENVGEGVAGVHEVADAGETAAERAAGVEVGEVVGLEAGLAGELEGEGVAEGEHGGGGGGGREIEGAGLLGDADVEVDEGGGGERGGGGSGEADDGHAEAGEDGQQAEQFFGLAGVGEGEDEVAAGEHAEVAVEGFDGMEEAGGGSGGVHGGGDFAGDDAGFSDAGEGDAMAAGSGLREQREGGVERRFHLAFEAVGETLERGGFDADEVGGARYRRGGSDCGHFRQEPQLC